MTIDKLYQLQESNFFNEEDDHKIGLFLQAVTDWPEHINTTEEFLKVVKHFLNTDDLTYETINLGMKRLNPANFSWELESLSSLLELTNLIVNNREKLENLFLSLP